MKKMMKLSLERIREKIENGERIKKDEGVYLFHSPNLLEIGEIAHSIKQKKHGDKVFFNQNYHLNMTNICVNRCELCAFSRDEDDDDAYCLEIEQIKEQMEMLPEGVTEIHIVNGLHPDKPFDYYLETIREIKKMRPDVHIQAFTAIEIEWFSRISSLSIEEVLKILKKEDLTALPGGGAEIFDPEIRQKICSKKISGQRWLEVMEVAHHLGIRTNATMLYGHIEKYEDRIDHLIKLRELQDKTSGFMAFIPLSFHPQNTKFSHLSKTTAFDDLKTHAVSRIMLDNFDHIKTFWIMITPRLSQVSLYFGVSDFDGTVVQEKITHSAGAQTPEALTKEEIVSMIKEAGKIPVERDTLYKVMA